MNDSGAWPEVVIPARKLTQGSSRKARYRLENGRQGYVEDVALTYLLGEGWRGLHSENAYWSMLAALLFWESAIGAARRFSVGLDQDPKDQKPPVTIFNPEFWPTYQGRITQRVGQLLRSNLAQEIRFAYQEHFGEEQLFFDNWIRFNADELCHAARAMPKKTLIDLLVWMLMDMPSRRKGLPDLFVWRENQPAFVEVKGPGDLLAKHQTEWLEFLSSLGIEVFLAKVVDEKDLEHVPPDDPIPELGESMDRLSKILDTLMKVCPSCTAEIEIRATKCEFCGTVFVTPEWQDFCKQYSDLSESEREWEWIKMSEEQQACFRRAWADLGYSSVDLKTPTVKQSNPLPRRWRILIAWILIVWGGMSALGTLAGVGAETDGSSGGLFVVSALLLFSGIKIIEVERSKAGKKRLIPRFSTTGTVVTVLAVLILSVFIMVRDSTRSESNAPMKKAWRSSATKEEVAATSRPAEIPAPPPSLRNVDQAIEGDEVILVSDGGSVVVAVDSEAFKELVSAVSDRDQARVQSLIQGGRGYLVQDRTYAEVVEGGYMACDVRILEGEHTGRTGRVLVKNLRTER